MGTRAQPAHSGERRRRTNDFAAARFSRASADRLWLARSTRDQLGVAWSAVTNAVSWQVVCWDSRDAAVARLRLTGEHRRATFARLAGLRQPFTIAVSGVGGDGSVLWQRGLADLYLRAESAHGDDRISDSRRARTQRGPAKQGRRDFVAAKRPKKDVAIGKTGGSSKPKPKKKTSRGK
jgi:hypothetical protein